MTKTQTDSKFSDLIRRHGGKIDIAATGFWVDFGLAVDSKGFHEDATRAGFKVRNYGFYCLVEEN